MKKPIYSIVIDDKDITSNFDKRLISMTITDNRGLAADTISIELDDSDGSLALPKRGVNMTVSLGWLGDNVILQNIFTIDKCVHSGSPDRISIQGQSANMRDSFNEKREQSYSDTTLGSIIAIIAKRQNLEYRIDKEIELSTIPHTDQTNESDASFLTRISNEFNAAVTLKNGMLVIFKKGSAKTISGETIPTTIINRQSGDQHRFSIADRDAYTGVKAYWFSYKNPTKQQVNVKRNPEKNKKEDTDVLFGADGNIKTLRHTYTNEQNAYQAAKNEWEKLQRGASQLSINLAVGRPDIYPEMPIEVVGFKKEIDSTLWTIAHCTHILNATKGYTTSIELEIKLEDG